MSLRVASYNVLADAYIHREWYPDTPTELLDPMRRRPALITRLSELRADVLCLQEVERPAFEDIATALEPTGFRGCFSPKGRGKPDGCATLFRDPVTLCEESALHYADESGHVALATVFETAGTRLGVVNTHLRWSAPHTPLRSRAGYVQLVELVSHLLQRRDLPWVLCGDFNVEPDSSELDLLYDIGFEEAFRDVSPCATCNINGRVRKIDYLFFTPELIAEPEPLPVLQANTGLPSDTEPSDHLPIVATFNRA